MRSDRREAFEQLCRREYPAVVRTAYLITGDREEALDVAQEAFARAYERWRGVSRMDRPGAWVMRVAANLALSWRRRQRVRNRRPAPVVGTTPPPELPDPDLAAALLALTPAQRTAVVLRYYADLPVADVARALGKRPGTVRALTSQGLVRLRASLSASVEADEREV